jgi:hypothetical protein
MISRKTFETFARTQLKDGIAELYGIHPDDLME